MKVVFTVDYNQEKFDQIRALGYELEYVNEDKIDESTFPYDADILVCFKALDHLDLDKFTKLKYIMLTSIGFDFTPNDKILEKNITLINNQGGYSIPMGEFIVVNILQLAKQNKDPNKKVAIADLDVVNPYFRSREKEDFLAQIGVESFSSPLKNSTLDLPAVSAEIRKPVIDETYEYVMDVGGDDVGARVLGSIKDIMKKSDYDMFLVINANREYTTNADEVIRYMHSIMGASGLNITGLINNTHLLWDTRTEDILKGEKLAKEVSEKTGIPLKYTVYPSYLDISTIKDEISSEIFTVDMIMREKWM